MDFLTEATNDLSMALSIAKGLDEIVDSSLPHKLAEIVKFHSKGAAGAGFASGWVPGLGGAAMAVTSAGFIWSMYARIGSEVGLNFSDNVLKTLASGVATNLAAYAVGIAAVSVISFIPLIGNISAAVIAAGVAYSMTLASGYVYMKILTEIFNGKIDPNSISEAELKTMADDVIKNEDMESIMKEAKKSYKR